MENDSIKSISPTDMSPTNGQCSCGSDSCLQSNCDSLFKREIGVTINNQKPKISEDEEAAHKLKAIAECVNINVRHFNGSKFSVQVALESTVESFKELIIGNCDIPTQNQRLIHKGKILQNDQSLQSYGLGENHTVYLVRCFAPTNSNDGTDNINNTTSDGVDGERDGFLGQGSPDFELMQPRRPLHASVHRRLIREFLSTPDMQHLIINPNILWNILTNSQELSSIVFDPTSVSRILEDARIPGIVREIRRLADLELNSVESIPGGFNLLRSIYEDMEEPNVTTTTGIRQISGTNNDGQARDQSNSDTNAGSSLPNTTPLPNPWPFTRRDNAVEGDQISNIRRSTRRSRRSTTDWDDVIQREPIILQRIDLSNVDSLLGGSIMPNTDGSTQLVQEFTPSDPDALCQQQLSSQQDSMSQLNYQQSTGESSQTTEAPEQLYATQLSQLQEMGFSDTEECLRALVATSGDVQAAVQRLSRNSNQ